MGTRLYPNTTDPKILEQLAGVPVGTAARYTELAAKQQQELVEVAHTERREMEERHYLEMHVDKALGIYDSFLLFGWGRQDRIPAGHNAEFGNTTDPAEIRAIGEGKGFTETEIHLILGSGGFHWS